MKAFFITIFIAMFISISIKETSAQTTETKLNQVELMKQFIGTWECELGNRTIYRNKSKAFGNGLVTTIQIFTNQEIVDSVKQLFGYDNKTDKYVVAELTKFTSVIEIGTAWFVTEQTGKIFITDSNGDELKFNFEFITPDLIKETATLENNHVVEMEFKRVK